jgi:hypothetical protein
MPDSSRAEQVINVPAKTIRNLAAGFWGESGNIFKKWAPQTKYAT